ncbi:MAG: bifunctional nicotinamidase/pyrazinamidase [Firmicutes bacterium]|nr:bifunctional nicotinamidase/pyrazinamidase [Bacillota bacterium]
MRLCIGRHDALVLVDIQNDFCPGGALPTQDGDAVVPVANALLACFIAQGALIVATRDWHPADHISFQQRGGPWPAHCVQGSVGAAFHPELQLPKEAFVVSKGMLADEEAYSGFQRTPLHLELQRNRIHRLFMAGLATEYCVRQTALDGLAFGYNVVVVEDGVRGVESQPGDGNRALQEVMEAGGILARAAEVCK